MKRGPGRRAQADALLLALIKQAHRESRQTYGRPRITHWLQTHGQRCGHMRVARLMRQLGLTHRRRRRFHPQSLTDSNHDLPVAPNLLGRREPTVQPDAVWVADIAYVPTDEGWLYVAGVLDRCTCRCVGWAFGDTLAKSLPLAALKNMALHQRHPPTGLVHHSDRGVQYASAAYRQRLAQAGCIPSMSRRGNCYDNALMESFWSTLKCGLVHREHFVARTQARAAIFEWIEVFYNRELFHSALGYKSPVNFETQLNSTPNRPCLMCSLSVHQSEARPCTINHVVFSVIVERIQVNFVKIGTNQINVLENTQEIVNLRLTETGAIL